MIELVELRLKKGKLVGEVTEVPVRGHKRKLKSEAKPQPHQKMRRVELEELYDPEVADVAEVALDEEENDDA